MYAHFFFFIKNKELILEPQNVQEMYSGLVSVFTYYTAKNDYNVINSKNINEINVNFNVGMVIVALIFFSVLFYFNVTKEGESTSSVISDVMNKSIEPAATRDMSVQCFLLDMNELNSILAGESVHPYVVQLLNNNPTIFDLNLKTEIP